jgi:hypothetical protein
VDSTPTSMSQSASDSLQVTITGEVNHTGTYLLALKSTLKDLLDAPGAPPRMPIRRLMTRASFWRTRKLFTSRRSMITGTPAR